MRQQSRQILPTLPTKPSELIRLALKDLAAVELDARYVVEMLEWHLPAVDECLVCLAGAVMAQTLGASPDRHLTPSEFPQSRQLQALDTLRYAHRADYLAAACEQLRARLIEWTERVPCYDSDPEGFHAVLGRLADAFEASGQ